MESKTAMVSTSAQMAATTKANGRMINSMELASSPILKGKVINADGIKEKLLNYWKIKYLNDSEKQSELSYYMLLIVEIIVSFEFNIELIFFDNILKI